VDPGETLQLDDQDLSPWKDFEHDRSLGFLRANCPCQRQRQREQLAAKSGSLPNGGQGWLLFADASYVLSFLMREHLLT
jgi:hypothetical protein